MNPNEIFYGPVDLLIVPQVLSLLTPNLLETTCWAWFFFVSFPPPVPFVIPFSAPLFIKVTQVLFHADFLKRKDAYFKAVRFVTKGGCFIVFESLHIIVLFEMQSLHQTRCSRRLPCIKIKTHSVCSLLILIALHLVSVMM